MSNVTDNWFERYIGKFAHVRFWKRFSIRPTNRSAIRPGQCRQSDSSAASQSEIGRDYGAAKIDGQIRISGIGVGRAKDSEYGCFKRSSSISEIQIYILMVVCGSYIGFSFSYTGVDAQHLTQGNCRFCLEGHARGEGARRSFEDMLETMDFDLDRRDLVLPRAELGRPS